MTLTSPTVPIPPTPVRRPESDPGPDPVARVLGGVAVAVGGAALVALLYALLVLDRTGRRLDDRAMRAAMSVAAGFRDDLRVVLEIAAPAAVVVVGVLVVRAWRAGDRAWRAGDPDGRGLRDRAVTAAVVVLGSQALTQALKALLPAPGEGNSLPSGHVTVALTTLVAVVLLMPRTTRAVLVLALPVVAVTGLATMMVGWHRPGDVLAAVGAVAVVSGLTSAVWAPAGALLPGPTRPRFG